MDSEPRHHPRAGSPGHSSLGKPSPPGPCYRAGGVQCLVTKEFQGSEAMAVSVSEMPQAEGLKVDGNEMVVRSLPVSWAGGGDGGDGSRGDAGEVCDKGASDSGGGGGQGSGSGGSGKQQQKGGSESSNSSQSGSGSRTGRRKTGGSCSGSSDSSGEEEDDDKERRPHHKGGGAGKEAKPKFVDEDDEATDSADEGVGDDATPNSMIMDFSPPQSNQSESGTDHTSTTKGPHFLPSTGTYSQQTQLSNRPTTLTPTPNHSEADTDVIGTPLDNQGATGTISIESMAPSESSMTVESSNAINMIVGYGVPASTPTQAPVDKSPLGSDLGTPTLDSPPLLGAKTTPLATPVPMLSPGLALLPQVTACHMVIKYLKLKAYLWLVLWLLSDW